MLMIERTRNVSELARHYGLKVHEMSGKDEAICKEHDDAGYDLWQTYNASDNSTLKWEWRKRINYGG